MIRCQRRRHPTDLIHPLNYLDFKLRTDNSAWRQGLARHRLPTEAQGTTCGPRPRTSNGWLQPPWAGRPACWGAAPGASPWALSSGAGTHRHLYLRVPDSRTSRRSWKVGSPPLPSPETGQDPRAQAGQHLLPSFPQSGGCRDRGAAPHPGFTLLRSPQMGLSAAK